MRIIAGEYRGRRLQGPRGRELRPTSDRLRETLFNILGPRAAGALVLDLFAGTGAIGIEALSRGAREAVFVESSPDSLLLIRKNLDLCGITSGYQIVRADIFMAMRSLARAGVKADVAFLDPPYSWGPYPDLLSTLFQLGLMRPEACVVLEHHRKAGVPESEPGFHRTRTVRQGDQCLSFYAIQD